MPRCHLNPQSPQATVCCYVSAAALVHFRPGGLGLPNRGFNHYLMTLSVSSYDGESEKGEMGGWGPIHLIFRNLRALNCLVSRSSHYLLC